LIAKYERIDFERGQEELATGIRELPGVASVVRLDGDGSYRVELSDGAAAERVLGLLLKSGVTSIRTTRPSLEEVYVHMMGDRGLKI